ncbi:bifunctional cytochrome P450/NADPH--P450 reductase [Pectobacterium aroidearum]|uniref:bifunctional cytochrome P450/NADPH--P450 reductase n=1 Tax=Pectobacterium aroidearum TaxID=1201031 RepID=UPI0021153673|nr:cytochrome P450 [Pectobacterium aroidearum]UUE44769.1 cytochrome P450 [Pectobacterium aroidearum]UUE48988.1 cytochrome P450 [Pectobacterium aroidearum]UUE53192.1 cytochrome P450 [Pectobacterium aroidearum]UUE61603.1 cytochrome P450 [Pectobacterium aroidearum]UUE65827.1 cytochrome P450 [Pectobacterium aroidearum]
MSGKTAVPQPPIKPVIGNLADVDPRNSIDSLMKLAKTYGPFFKMRIFSDEFYVASSQELVNELSDESLFEKKLSAELLELRYLGGDGLFTAHTHEPNWGKAHRILMPALGPLGVRSMFDKMLDISEQMFLRWERFGPDVDIDVADNMTRLTLDTIALCGFDYRFNSFYRDDLLPFVKAIVGSLKEAGLRVRRPGIVNKLMIPSTRQYRTDKALMYSVVEQLIAARKMDPKASEKNDLLNRMLNGVDPQTGEKLSDENIAHQMLTFLVAGHETTSGMLSFTIYFLLKNPDVLNKARAIVDEVLGDEIPRIEHLAQLRYLEQILMESLRMWPTAGGHVVSPIQDTILAGKYHLTPKDSIVILQPQLHRDVKAWGDDANLFKPERFGPDNAENLLPNSWQPFGAGKRACIGRMFAMQEAQLVLAMMLQRFDFELSDPSYELKIIERLTIKPDNLKIRIRVRKPSKTLVRGVTPKETSNKMAVMPVAKAQHHQDLIPLLVLHGGNTGSSEAFANRIAADAQRYGFASTLAALDDYAEKLPQTGALIVITASYEGMPPNNARHFVPWVEGLADDALSGLKFSVFGCGNLQWVRTYQAIPKRVDLALEHAGGQRIHERGVADSGGDFFGNFDDWYTKLWPALTTAFGRQGAVAEDAAELELEFVHTDRVSTLQIPDMGRGVVVENRELVDMTSPFARSKRHIEIRLPEGMAYRAGDYLAVLPRNSDDQIDRVLRRFGLSPDMMLVINQAPDVTGLPIGQPISCAELLGNYVELSQPATRAQVAALAAATRCPPEKMELEKLASEHYENDVLVPRLSVLDLLYRFQSCPIDFRRYLTMLPSIKARQYSISSSPAWKPDHVTLTVAVVDSPALSGIGRYKGVASNYLASLKPDDRIAIVVRPSSPFFHLPDDPSIPIILIGAGSGIAPFRGFLQERALQQAAGVKVGPALLFFGTGHPDVDYLYRDELAAWEKSHIVTVLPAFSHQPDGEVTFVQHRVWADRERIKTLFCNGGSLFVCGDGLRMVPEVRDMLLRIYREATGSNETDAMLWADKLEREQGRYVVDMFI